MPTHTAAAPLQTFRGSSKIPEDREEAATWNGQVSKKTFHLFRNSTDQPVDLFWFYDRQESHRGTIQPGSNLYVGTYTFHQWKVKSITGQLLGVHAGQSAVVTVMPQGCRIEFNAATADADGRDATSIATPRGTYAVRTQVFGMPVWAFDCVSDAAVRRLVYIVARMLEGAPADVMARMAKCSASFGILGPEHSVTDAPPHAFMRYNTNRDLNVTSRGLGATPTVPHTTCGEENLLMEGDSNYSSQSILVHELGHAVMNLGMGREMRTRLQAAYECAAADGLYPPSCYIMTNDHEYWAVGTEAWFESTIRKDINGGVNTRGQLKAHDPRLASIMAEIWGDGLWRYQQDCPRPLCFTKRQRTCTSTSASQAASRTAAALGNGSAVRHTQAVPAVTATTVPPSGTVAAPAATRKGLAGGASGVGPAAGAAVLQQEPMSREDSITHLVLLPPPPPPGELSPGGVNGSTASVTGTGPYTQLAAGNSAWESRQQYESPTGASKRGRQEDTTLTASTAAGTSHSYQVPAALHHAPASVAGPQQPEVMHAHRRARWECAPLCPGARLSPAAEAAPLMQEDQDEGLVCDDRLSSCLGSSVQGPYPAKGTLPGAEEYLKIGSCSPVHIMLCMPQVSAPFASCLRAKAPRDKQSQ